MITDPDPATGPDPALFVSDFQDANFFKISIAFAYYFLWVHLHQSLKITYH
jgi:hypothetical protein